ncbi:hypothetical protein BDZ94DRAFT_1327381 [Collybia nuda]|uniref:Uncharacterized protein n=1 Tax=Collybia nuda TaxID=64659 RepID=A0A9P5XQA5_9AGAR|nr:hypothetical protein BDZ94DRAFT_1327486 [Collybia nuda]KAF9455801.1 hypothetical protein BDZ94DRAFT_1327381 [Collybia nuda]
MAPISPNVPEGVNLGHLLDILAQMGITPSPEQATELSRIGGGHLIPVVTGITNSAPKVPPVIVIEDSDSDDNTHYPGYPEDTGSDSDGSSPPTASKSMYHEPSPPPASLLDTHTSNASTGIVSEGEELKPGAYLECQTCGALSRLVTIGPAPTPERAKMFGSLSRGRGKLLV